MFLTAALLCLALSLGLPLLIYRALRQAEAPRAARWWLGLSYGWMVLLCLLASAGAFSNFGRLPPPLMPALLPPLLAALLLTFHPASQPLIQKLSPAFLIGFQSFRVPVELFLWLLFFTGDIPLQMTFEGRNWDILTGLSAAGLGLWLWKRQKQGQGLPKAVLLIWNLLGLGLLINIVVISVLSMPTPLRLFMNAPANTIVASFPFVLLPALLVPFAYTFHMLSLRQLWLASRQT